MEKLFYKIQHKLTVKEINEYADSIEEKTDIKKNNISLKKFLIDEIENRGIDFEFMLDWFLDNSNNETIRNFINWVLE